MAESEPINIYETRLAQASALERLGIDPYPQKAPKRTHKNSEVKRLFENLEGQEVAVVGRVMQRRDHGKLIFADLNDQSDVLQTMWTPSNLGVEKFETFRDLSGRGDFLGVIGEVMKTRKGEITVAAKDLQMLTKALRVSPEKLVDDDTRQRQRYLDTLVNPDSQRVFRVRSLITQHMRDYFINKLGALEVETPVLDTTYGGASAKPFKTHMNALDEDMYMRISNELYLKRMTAGGYYEGVFEFSRNFRNEGIDKVHNPEFTLMELYMPFWDYENMMDMAEDLMSSLVYKIHGSYKAPYGDHVVNYAKPWRRLSVYESFRDKLGRDAKGMTDQEIADVAANLKVEKFGRDDQILAIVEALWEKDLINPTFMKDFPVGTSALAKRHRDDPAVTERFELYVAGAESMNCYTELNDPRDQRARFETERAKRAAGDEEAMPFDEDFITMQEYGMPLQSGIGISVDRWTMLMCNIDNIRDTIYFPQLRRLR